MKTALGLLLLVLMMTAAARAQSGPLTITERGFFSVSFPVSYLESRLLNSDGSLASYKGYQAGLGLDVQLWGGAGELRLFGSYLLGEVKGDPSSNKIKREETFFGLKVYPNSRFFLAAGMGRLTNRVSSAGASDVTLTAPLSGFGAGFEMALGPSWFLSTGAWYKSGPIKQNENTGINHNSFADGAELQLMFVWSPPSSTTTIPRSR